MTDYRGADYRDLGANEDRTLPAVCYALYLLGLTHGLTIIIAVVIAYASRATAGPVMRSHYNWLIRTFWLSIVLVLVGVMLIFWGGIFSIILVGLPFFALGWVICGSVWVWTLLRCVIGVIAVARDEPIQNPDAWLL
jgi:uncharacterized membrane protein